MARTGSLLALAGLGLVACATNASSNAGTSRDRETFAVSFRSDAAPAKRVLPAPVQAVWAALPQVFADLGYPGGPSARPEERVYLTRSLTVRGRLYEGDLNSDYLDCGRTPAGPPAADTYEITFAILARLTPRATDSTLVEVLVDGRARDRTQSSNPVFCSGTGRLEAALLQRLEARTSSSTR
jgi:hypothetical protein